MYNNNTGKPNNISYLEIYSLCKVTWRNRHVSSRLSPNGLSSNPLMIAILQHFNEKAQGKRETVMKNQ